MSKEHGNVGNCNNPNGHLPTLIPGGGEGGKETQFGGPRGNKRGNGSIRGNIRRLAHMHPEDAQDLIGKAETMAELIAARKYQVALSGDVKAMQQLEDSVDGRLVEKKVEAEVTLADLVNKSFEVENEERDGEGES